MKVIEIFCDTYYYNFIFGSSSRVILYRVILYKVILYRVILYRVILYKVILYRVIVCIQEEKLQFVP